MVGEEHFSSYKELHVNKGLYVALSLPKCRKWLGISYDENIRFKKMKSLKMRIEGKNGARL